MATEQAMQQASASLSPLSPEHRRGLTAVAFFGLLSFISSTLLFLWLSYKVFTELRRRRQSSTLRVSQFLILIYNLIFADMLQSVGFMLNSRWVSLDGVLVSDKACIAQGWFISVGNLSSGVFTLAIAIHLFADITFDYHLPQVTFLSCLAALWCLVHVLAVAGFAAHASDYYARAGPWCWVSGKYAAERLWLHYFWVIVAEFGTVIIYGAILAILQRRLHTSYYATPSTALRARSAARLIIIYPIVYVVCTLPLIVVRLKGMEHWTPSVSLMCAVGALITCIGWLDVVVYGLTRGTLLFGRASDRDNNKGLDTFVTLRSHQEFGTTTTITAHPQQSTPTRRGRRRGRKDEEIALRSHDGSLDRLFNSRGVRSHTVVEVQSEVRPVDPFSTRSSEEMRQ